MTRAAPVVVGIGEVLWDRFPDADRLGGAPANFAFHAAQLGADSRIVSRIGCDADGDRLSKQLEGRNLSLEHLQRDSIHPTGTVLVQLREGQPTYTINDPAAWDYIQLTEDLRHLASRADAVCFGTLSQRNPGSRQTVQEFIRLCPPRAVRLFDINLRQAFYTRDIIESGLRLATILKLNADELLEIARIFEWEARTEVVMRELFHRFPLTLIAVTRGAAGCELHTRAEAIQSPAPEVACIDAVGAGDAFSAALVIGLLRNDSLQEIADQANRIGSYVAGQPGAMPELPRELVCL